MGRQSSFVGFNLPFQLLLILPILFVISTPSHASRVPISPNQTEETSDCDLGDDEILATKESIHVCDDMNSENWFIYCGGKLLEVKDYKLTVTKPPLFKAVNFHQLLEGNDSKDFVDRPMKKNSSEILELFESQFGTNGSVRDIPKEKLNEFLNENFDKAGGELKRLIG